MARSDGIKIRAQSISEYSIFLAIVLIALAGINVYVKRGLQGRYKDVVKVATAAVSAKEQYEPYYATTGNPDDTPKLVVGVSRSASMTTGELDAKGKIITPGEGKITKSLSNLAGEPTTVQSTSVEGAAPRGEELEQGTFIEVK